MEAARPIKVLLGSHMQGNSLFLLMGGPAKHL